MDMLFALSCLGAGLLSLLLLVLSVVRMRHATVVAHTAPALCDLLDYATLADDHVIVLKSGALMQVFQITLPDLHTFTENEIRQLYERTRTALLKLDGAYCVQVDVIREGKGYYLPFVENDQPLIRDLEARRAALFQKQSSFSSELYLTLTYRGTSSTRHTLEQFLVETSDQQKEQAEHATRQLIYEFNSNCKKVFDSLQAAFEIKVLGPETISRRYETPFLPPLQQHAALSFIHHCLTGQKHILALPQHKVYLDALLATQDYYHGFLPKIGDKNICVIALDGLPAEAKEGLLNSLGHLPFAFRFNARFIYFDSLKSQLLLQKYRRFWAQKSKGILAQVFNVPNARLNQNAVDKMAELDQVQRALDNNETNYGAYTATLIIMDEDIESLRHKKTQAITLIEDLGFSARVETVNASDAFFGSLPGHFYENVRRPLVSQEVLLDFIPLSLPDKGEEFSPNPFYGQHASPLMQVRVEGQGSCCLNIHEQDLGNSLIIGPSGSGKSVLLGELMINLLRYRGMRIFAFDKDCSFYALTKALHGQHINFDNSTASFCPLAQLESDLDFDYALDYVLTLLRLSDYVVTPQDKVELTRALQLLRQYDQHSLSQFHLLLSSMPMKIALQPYLNQKNHHSLIDSEHNMALNQQITTFECAEIFKAAPSFSLPLLKQVFHLIGQHFDGRPAAIILDEAWLMLQDPYFAQELLAWFKTLRKFNAVVILATQSLTDLQRSEHFVNILECAKTRFYLPNYDASNPGLKEIYEVMGLSPKEIDIIAHARAKRDYFFVKNKRRVLFQLMLSPEELRLLSYAGAHQKAHVDMLYQLYGDSFYVQATHQ